MNYPVEIARCQASIRALKEELNQSISERSLTPNEVRAFKRALHAFNVKLDELEDAHRSIIQGSFDL